MEQLKDQLLENNKQTYWVPDFVKVQHHILSDIGVLYKRCSSILMEVKILSRKCLWISTCHLGKTFSQLAGKCERLGC